MKWSLAGHKLLLKELYLNICYRKVDENKHINLKHNYNLKSKENLNSQHNLTRNHFSTMNNYKHDFNDNIVNYMTYKDQHQIYVYTRVLIN